MSAINVKGNDHCDLLNIGTKICYRGCAVRMNFPKSKGHIISVAASAIAALAAALAFFGAPGWAPMMEQQMTMDFAVCWVLLTYLWVQLFSHIIFGTTSKNEMLVDMLSSIAPVLVISYVLAEYYRGDLQLSQFQANAAWLTAYAMLLDLVVDTGLAIALRRQV